MSFRRNPTLSNNVISFKEGPLLQEPLSILKDEITMLRGKLDDMRSDTRSDSRTEAMGRIDMLEKSLMVDTQKTSPYRDQPWANGPHVAPRDHTKPHSQTMKHDPPVHHSQERQTRHRPEDHVTKPRSTSARDGQPPARVSPHSEPRHEPLISQEPLISTVMDKLERLEQKLGSTHVADELRRLEVKVGTDVMDKIACLESSLQGRMNDSMRIASSPVLSKLSEASVTSNKVMTMLSALESRLSDSPVLSKLNALESLLSDSPVMNRLDALESRISPDHVMGKLSALESNTAQFMAAMSRLETLQSNMETPVKESVKAKLDLLEMHAALPCSSEALSSEMRRLSKLNNMRTKIANA